MTTFKVGDHVVVCGEIYWQGDWDEVPATITDLIFSGSGSCWVTLDHPIEGWLGLRAYVPCRSLFKEPLEVLVAAKLGDDYL